MRRLLLSLLGVEEDMKITEYVVTEDADRSLWLNEKNIKCVKGVNLIVSSNYLYKHEKITTRQGAITMLLFLWDGTACECTVALNTSNNQSHLRGFCIPCSAYSMLASITQLVAGDTSKIIIDNNGVLSCTTSATGVTTGNYNNSFFESGKTYYLIQIPNNTIC